MSLGNPRLGVTNRGGFPIVTSCNLQNAASIRTIFPSKSLDDYGLKNMRRTNPWILPTSYVHTSAYLIYPVESMGLFSVETLQY